MSTELGDPLTENSVAKQKLRTSPNRQATSPKDTPKVAILERRETVSPDPFFQSPAHGHLSLP